jgi:cobalt-precorrin 5A hydrolase
MGLDQAMIVAGIGCRAGATAHEIDAAIAAALSNGGLAKDALNLIATSSAKASEEGVAAAASARGVPLTLVAQADLEAASGRAVTRSERVQALAGVPSVAECAALAAAGASARLVVPRVAVGPATCALAVTGDMP